MNTASRDCNDKDLARHGAIQVINELLGDTLELESFPEHFRVLDQRIAIVQDSIDAHHQLLRAAAKSRQQSLHLLAETNRSTLNKARETLACLDTVMQRTEKIMEPVLLLHRQQQQLTKDITLMEQFKSFILNLDTIEKILVSVEMDDQEAYRLSHLAPLLLASQQFAALFRKLELEEHCKLVRDNLLRFEALQAMVKRRLMALFERQLKPDTTLIAPDIVIKLSHAALSIQVLGEAAKTELIAWYCEKQLLNYMQVFRQNRELFNLESLGKRYAWLHQVLQSFQTTHASIFEGWDLDMTLCKEFCEITAKDIHDIVSAGKNADLVTIQDAVQQTKTFQGFLLQRFPTLDPQVVKGLMRAFEPCTRQILQVLEQNLKLFVSECVKAKLMAVSKTERLILESAVELFNLLCLSLDDFSSFSQGRSLRTLSLVFGQQLGEYSAYLMAAGNVKKRRKSESSVFMGFKFGDVSTIKNSQETPEHLKTMALLINTAVFCSVKCGILSDRVKALLEHCEDSDDMTFDSQIQDFLVTSSILQGKLHDALTDELAVVWEMMKANDWAGLQTVGDRSAYVAKCQRLFTELMPILRSNFADRRIFASICNRTATHVMREFSKFLNSGLKKVNETVAQQLLIDLECFKTILSDCLRVGPEYDDLRKTLSTVLKDEANDLEALLKCLMLALEPLGEFVANYILVRPGGDETKFLALLEKRRIKVTLPYLTEFRKRIPESQSVATSSTNGTPNDDGTRKPFKFFSVDGKLGKLF